MRPPPSGEVEARTVMPPRSVNFSALPSRLNRICRTRVGSPISVSSEPGSHRAGEHQSLGARLRLERAHHAVDQAGEREHRGLELEPPGLDLGEVEHVVDDAQERLRAVAHGRDGAALRGVEPLAVEHFHHAEHAVHRRADLVAHGGKEGRLRLVGGFRLGAVALGRRQRHLGGVLRFGLRLLALLQLGDVAEHAEEAAIRERLVGELDEAAARCFRS